MIKMSDAVERIEEGLEHLGQRASLAKAETKVAALKLKQTIEEAKTSVRKHPMMSIGAALTLGGILGTILGRRRKNPTIEN